MDRARVVALLGLSLLVPWQTAGCKSSSSAQRDPRVTVVKPGEEAPPTEGVPPHKNAEIQLVLQQREPSARKCYQDVLNEKHDRSFQGTVQLLIELEPSGRASAVKVVGGTLNDQSVRDCLVSTISAFEFPQLDQAGSVQYTYQFRPAY